MDREIYYQERAVYDSKPSLSNRELLENIGPENIQNKLELALILEHKKFLGKISSLQKELNEFYNKEYISFFDKIKMNKIKSEIDEYDKELQRIENIKGIKELIKREWRNIETKIAVNSVRKEQQEKMEEAIRKAREESFVFCIAKELGLDGYGLSCGEYMAVAILAKVKEFLDENKDTLLSHTSAACCDVFFFSCFVVRAISLSQLSNYIVPEKFSNDFVSNFLKYINYNYIPSLKNLEKMFDNRMSFYDEIFAKKKTINEKFEAILEEFKLIIKTDYVNKGYVDYNAYSPLPIIDFENDFETEKIINDFYKNLIKETDMVMSDVKANSGEVETKKALDEAEFTEIATHQNDLISDNSFISTENNKTLVRYNNFCRRCGAKLAENSKFCHKCGTKII